MKDINYLPLGSVVIIKGGVKKYMIVSRGLKVDAFGQMRYFDYAACEYPEGISGDRLFYFHHADIIKEIFKGYSDEDDKIMIDTINRAHENTTIERANIEELKKKVQG